MPNSSGEGWVRDTLTINKQEIEVRSGKLRQADLRFFPENPRIYSIVSAQSGEPSQAVIERRLGEMEHVKQLVQSIRANGGLTDPLIVREGDNVVFEGNSRLAAYRILCRNNPIEWGMVKVKLLPHNIGQDLVFALLGEYHIIGRKDWAPYEQAGYLYRRHQNYGVDPATMADEMGLSTRNVNHLIRVYSFMVEHNDNDVNRWSYYEEYLKSRPLRRTREVHPDLDGVVVEKIKSGEIAKAIEIREMLVPIAKAGGPILDEFRSKPDSFRRAYDRAEAKGVDNVWYKRFHKFREMVVDSHTREDLVEMDETHRRKCAFELGKIQQAITALMKGLS